MSTTDGSAVQFVAPGEVDVVSVKRPDPEPDEVVVEAAVSAVSAGTELLVYHGDVDDETITDEELPAAGAGRSHIRSGTATPRSDESRRSAPGSIRTGADDESSRSIPTRATSRRLQRTFNRFQPESKRTGRPSSPASRRRSTSRSMRPRESASGSRSSGKASSDC